MPFPRLPDDVIDALIELTMETARRESAGRPLKAKDTIRIMVRLVECELEMRMEQQAADDHLQVA